MMQSYILRWSLKSTRTQYLAGMSETGPTLTTERSEAIVFPSRREAMFHPANIARGCGFEPVPAKRVRAAAPAVEVEP